VAICAYHIALFNLLANSRQGATGKHAYVESFLLWVSVVEVHHIVWKLASTVGARLVLGLSNQLVNQRSCRKVVGVQSSLFLSVAVIVVLVPFTLARTTLRLIPVALPIELRERLLGVTCSTKFHCLYQSNPERFHYNALRLKGMQASPPSCSNLLRLRTVMKASPPRP
jgi:hypothetical protein